MKYNKYKNKNEKMETNIRNYIFEENQTNKKKIENRKYEKKTNLSEEMHSIQT